MATAKAGKISYIDNGKVKLGINLDIGGAITYLSKSGSDVNLINNFDWGRQIQMSYYSGPNPFEPNGHKPHPAWKLTGWNPIQTGDVYGNGSKVLEHKKNGNSLYVKCIPMQWALNNVPGECSFECWITLKGNAVVVKSRMINSRSDKTQYERQQLQELPAVYCNGPWYRVITYDGDKPYTGDKLTQYPSTWPPKGWLASENWAALVDDKDWGLGIYEPGTYTISGGFSGQPGEGGPKDTPTGYLSPYQEEILDSNIDTSFNYVLILGNLQEIRDYVYKQPRPAANPNWVFTTQRHYWTYQNAGDTGCPIRGELNIDISKSNVMISSPVWLWDAAKNPVLYIKAAYTTSEKQATVLWERRDLQPSNEWGGKGFGVPTEAEQISFPITGDGKYRVYAVRLANSAAYHGLITKLHLKPTIEGAPGRRVKLTSIGFVQPTEARK